MTACLTPVRATDPRGRPGGTAPAVRRRTRLVTGAPRTDEARRTARAVHQALTRAVAEYRDMPTLALTAAQAGRLWGLDHATLAHVLRTLVDRGVLCRVPEGRYRRGRALFE